MVLIEIISEGNITSYIFNEEESLTNAVSICLLEHFQECNSVGKLYKVTRV